MTSQNRDKPNIETVCWEFKLHYRWFFQQFSAFCGRLVRNAGYFFFTIL
jgi:hypothetical protein